MIPASSNRSRLASAGVLGALLVLVVVVVAGYVRAYPLLSPVDELQHIDYLDRATGFGVVRAGDRVREPAMREEACRRVDAHFDMHIPECDEPELDPAEFQEQGFNTAYVHPPTYYVVTGTIGRVIDAAPGIASWVTAGRLAGALWLGLAVVLTWWLFAELGIAVAIRVPLLVVMICAPATMLASATITPDVTALAAGAGVLLAVVLWESKRAHWVWPVLACGIAIACKSTNGIGVLVALGYLGVRSLQSRRALGAPAPTTGARTTRELVTVGAGILAAAAIVGLAWVGVARAIQRSDPESIPMIERSHVDSIGASAVRANVTAGFTPLKDAYLPDFLEESSAVRTYDEWLDVVVAVGAVLGIAYAGAWTRLRALGVAAVVVCLAAGTALVVANFVFSGIYVDIPPRYALSALPGLLAVCAVPLERRFLLVAASAFAAALTFSTLWSIY